jgi:P-type E1-E2 ATPase
MREAAAMLEFDIPSYHSLRFLTLVADFNGTLACDGKLRAGVKERLAELAQRISVHIVTGDIHGTARTELGGVPCHIEVLPGDEQAQAKRDYVQQLGAATVVAVGNGRNDRLMLRAAGLGIAVVEQEGTAAEALMAADIAAPSIDAALGLLLRPKRLSATLRG